MSQSHDVFENLAVEESLLRAGACDVLLWINDPCVVIGRNQDPLQETDVAFLEARGIALARRKSGGGAVYHDRGNLNYSLMADEPCADEAVALALDVLARVGIEACHGGGNDIMTGGAKVGGMAECRDGRWLCHGTLMASVDMSVLERALTPPPSKLAKHGIRSVRSRVRNLSELAPGIGVDSLVGAFQEALGTQPIPACIAPADRARARSLKSPAWVYGSTPHAPSADARQEA